MALNHVISVSNESPEERADALEAYGLTAEPDSTRASSVPATPTEETPVTPSATEAAPVVPVAETHEEDDDEAPEGVTTEKAKGKWARRTEKLKKAAEELAAAKQEADDLKKRLAAKSEPITPDADKQKTTPKPVAVEVKPEEVPAFPEQAPTKPNEADYFDAENPDYIDPRKQTKFLDDMAAYREDLREFNRRKAEWTSTKTKEIEQKKTKESATAAELEAENKSRFERIASQLTEARKSHPDFDTKVQASMFSKGILAAALNPDDTENGPEVLVYLADHPEELKRLNELTSQEQELPGGQKTATLASYNRAIREIAKIEDSMAKGKANRIEPPAPVATPPPDKRPPAPPPAAQLPRPPIVPPAPAARPSGEVDWDDADLKTYRAAKRKA